jgi:anthranilate synthase component 1
LESAELTQHSGRYSLLGSSPRIIFTARGREIEIEERGIKRGFTCEGDPLAELEKLMKPFRPLEAQPLPVFHGGAVGYLAYDMVRFFEPTLSAPNKDELGLPDMVFMVTDTVLIFDHRTRRLSIVANVHTDEHPNLEAAYEWARQQIAAVITKLEKPLAAKPLQTFAPVSSEELPPPVSNTTRDEYEAMVLKMKEYIAAGDIFQGVPSQRFETEYEGTTVDLFRALRHVNPSPYMFCIDFPQGFALVGSSPEVHVKCMNGRIDIRPIAGTRWRGQTAEEDDALAQDLLNDPQERAEHIMLVDLARNDVGRAAQFGSVSVDELMIVERYSHVMHIVSNVVGELADGLDAIDVLRATFPAGTVSGAPKVRAMEIIDELEPVKRGIYGGACGYLSFGGEMDLAIAIRTGVIKDGMLYAQAAAGIVADSVPEMEWQETENKARAVLRAAEQVQDGLDGEI